MPLRTPPISYVHAYIFTIVSPPVTPHNQAESRMCVLFFKERPGQYNFGVSITLVFASLPLSSLFCFYLCIGAEQNTNMSPSLQSNQKCDVIIDRGNNGTVYLPYTYSTGLTTKK